MAWKMSDMGINATVVRCRNKSILVFCWLKRFDFEIFYFRGDGASDISALQVSDDPLLSVSLLPIADKEEKRKRESFLYPEDIPGQGKWKFIFLNAYYTANHQIKSYPPRGAWSEAFGVGRRFIGLNGIVYHGTARTAGCVFWEYLKKQRQKREDRTIGKAAVEAFKETENYFPPYGMWWLSTDQPKEKYWPYTLDELLSKE